MVITPKMPAIMWTNPLTSDTAVKAEVEILAIIASSVTSIK
ncbi:MAG: hypothetical protein Q4A29_09490 [Eubacteriales bacterium]|nr:hypothetical protein [Eubacteriales bacterium]